MVGVGLALDVALYDRAARLPARLARAAARRARARARDGRRRACSAIDAPLEPARRVLRRRVARWPSCSATRVFPLLRLLVRARTAASSAARALAPRRPLRSRSPARSAIAWATLPPTVHLPAGVHQGRSCSTSAQTLVGEPGAVVRGGIVDPRRRCHRPRRRRSSAARTGSRSTTRATSVLEGVRVVGATLDGIHVRRSRVTIRDCDDRLARPTTRRGSTSRSRRHGA